MNCSEVRPTVSDGHAIGLTPPASRKVEAMSSTASAPELITIATGSFGRLNNDMAYDQFVRMQLAGDMLAPDDIEGAAATGFLVAGPYPGQITAKTVERIRYDQLDDMMMTMGGSMLGLTLGCVRCHEHKYDPIPHQDYYALAASLAQTAHGPRTLDLDAAATERAIGKHQAEQQPLETALSAFASNELPARFTAWHSKELAMQPDATRWQTLEPITLEAERSWLKGLPGGIIAHDAPLNPGTHILRRGQRRSVASEELYRLTFPDTSEKRAVSASGCTHGQVAATTWTGTERRRKFSAG